MTYVLLSLVFLAVAAIVLFFALATAPDRRGLLRRWAAPVAVAGVALVVLTAVFDNLMIAAGLVTYADATLSGLRLGSVPIEDFAYPLAGLLLLPALWLLLRPLGDRT
ncbi:lycopene e-cyclase isoprenoid transferase B [Leifsonia xyli subsp. xyli]|uniref:Lycopene e-cyclase isoprenoid transferase B n=2 Tax=Leifsonia xyli subsp. xyli TaxID=59736 RepID=Q6AE32_LEIXX|nr:lycopene cyclase domain-containing protein [Leifsonia xyli]AAT89364.1 lycopene e-cyclase isoprenoid transferase B [Leifsonia xyli subsp. xyli str. CTCB07]ODA89687.1 lycopene e-cyclase isoprenoid transferase B [Leifsonia xyli subsp. xyli]